MAIASSQKLAIMPTIVTTVGQAGEQQMDPGHDGPPLGRARPSWSLGPDVGEVVPPGRHSSNGGAPRPPLPGTGYSRFSA
ncbi:hypothetical protein G6F40_017619 [Rhizopus arrhizus]|nr:hypothetical protein G6F40_017619 [Rhizopus arrhizus]